MAQINTGDFKKGMKFVIDGEPYEMVECNFVKPGKGQALYKSKLRNLLKGTLLDRTYKSGESLEGADVRNSDGVYSYADGESYHFMDNESFESFPLPKENVESMMQFLTEGDKVSLLFWDNQLIGMTPPKQVTLEITYTEEAAKGNTATNVTKAATVSTGAEIQVPAFLKQGDMVRVEVESGNYMGRVNE